MEGCIRIFSLRSHKLSCDIELGVILIGLLKPSSLSGIPYIISVFLFVVIYHKIRILLPGDGSVACSFLCTKSQFLVHYPVSVLGNKVRQNPYRRKAVYFKVGFGKSGSGINHPYYYLLKISLSRILFSGIQHGNLYHGLPFGAFLYGYLV